MFKWQKEVDVNPGPADMTEGQNTKDLVKTDAQFTDQRLDSAPFVPIHRNKGKLVHSHRKTHFVKGGHFRSPRGRCSEIRRN